MARPRTPEPKAPSGFIASAVRLPVPSRKVAGRTEGWQSAAWDYWDTVGELRFIGTWIGNVLSRATLMAAKRVGRLLEPVSTGPAAEAMEALYGGPQGQAEMLQAIGVHLTVAGENYLVNRERNDQWNVLSSGKVTERAKGQLWADFGLEGGSQSLGRNDLVVRIWTPHPRDPTKADSPTRSNLGTLAQIAAYDRHIAAQLQSRLVGAGILFISNEITFPTPPGADPAASQADNFMSLLGESMLTPLRDPADPSALVPIVAMVPTESLGKNELVRFWGELDDAVVEMRDAAIKRFALGMDVPPEVLLGVADANHWNAWLSEESAVKAHLEPRLEVIVHALTGQYLRPSLKGEVEDPQDFFVIADTSSIRLRPNRSAEAVELYDRGELSGQALRRETGFQPEDAPAKQELTRWLLRKLATGATSPELAQEAARLLGVEMNAAVTAQPQQPDDAHRTDTAPQLPERLPPQMEEARARAEGMAAACNVLVYRALERAGNRLKNTHPRTDTSQVAAIDVYRSLTGEADKLLEGAWECAPDVLGPYDDDPRGVIETLDFYVRGLLSTKRPHSAVVLNALLDSRPKALPV